LRGGSYVGSCHPSLLPSAVKFGDLLPRFIEPPRRLLAFRIHKLAGGGQAGPALVNELHAGPVDEVALVLAERHSDVVGREPALLPEVVPDLVGQTRLGDDDVHVEQVELLSPAVRGDPARACVPQNGISSSSGANASMPRSGSRSGPLVRVTSDPANIAFAATTSGNASISLPTSSIV